MGADADLRAHDEEVAIELMELVKDGGPGGLWHLRHKGLRQPPL